VQNRGAQPVSGLTLDVNAAGTSSSQLIGSLAPGETFVLKVPVDQSALKAAGTLRFATELKNPAGLNDQNRWNNRRSSTLSAPGK
jgi:hypothetical protein